VLYISVRREAAARAIEDQRGIVWRYGPDGDLIGATIMDFGDLWSDKPEELAEELARRFDMPSAQTMIVVERALEDIRH
jgi:hypothetical protein